mmetsp:Transcript_31473/g.86570  ORF Transcript_31473/g.86570 Transcript_31473/m.86570 type:complete len:768 (-) Transcript_31473:339-2642(-)
MTVAPSQIATGILGGQRTAFSKLLAVLRLLHGTSGLATQPASAVGAFAAQAKVRPGEKPVLETKPQPATSDFGAPDSVAPSRLHAIAQVPPDATTEAPSEATSQYLRQEYQCGSEYSEPKYGCKTCNTNRICACDGIVRFGSGSTWSRFVESSGELECSPATFGEGPGFGPGRVCMCRPRVYVCATEWPRPWANCTECNMRRTCNCVGQVRFGYAETWGDWQDVNGTISCERASFGDTYVGQGKVCQCQPLDMYAEPKQMSADESLSGDILTSIVVVVLTYFFVYALLAIVRAVNQIKTGQAGLSAFERVLEAATAQCVYFAPMLCVLFFAASQRADALTMGASLQYSLPPAWLQVEIGVCAGAFAVQTLAFLVAEWVATRGRATLDGVEAAMQLTPQQQLLVGCWRTIYAVATGIMYAALACAIGGVLSMREPQAVREWRGETPMSAGIVCTLVLAVVYFGVYLVLHVFRNEEYNDVGRRRPAGSFGMEVMKLAATSMNSVPMLCILFMGTQIAVVWADATLPRNATGWMCVCVASVLLQLCLVVATPFLAEAELQVAGDSGEAKLVTESHTAFVCASVVRWVVMSVLYLGVAVLCFSLWSAGAPPAVTRQLCCFVCIYFAAYLALWIAISARQLSWASTAHIIRVLGICKDTVVFCPMLAALHLGLFVRAHRITNVYGMPGQPQSYVQDFMVIATAAIVVQLCTLVLAGCYAQPSPYGKLWGAPGFYFFCFHAAMLAIFVSLSVVVYGLFTITRYNASGRDAWFA